MLKPDLIQTNQWLGDLCRYETRDVFARQSHQWMASKREFTRQEVISGSWHKVGDDDSDHGVRFHPDHTLHEWNTSQPEKKWGGFWTIQDGLLHMTIGDWEIHFVANEDGNTHSGISFKAGSPKPYACYTLTHYA